MTKRFLIIVYILSRLIMFLKYFHNFLFLWLIIAFFWFFNISLADAENLVNRINNYPHWTNKVNLPAPVTEIIYPEWFAGNWQLTNILTEQTAPLAPNFKTPGFDNNSIYINKKITFPVKFTKTILRNNKANFLPKKINQDTAIIADRLFNSQSISRAYMGADNIKSIEINPLNSTEQITTFQENNQLISSVIGRQQQNISPEEFLTSELTRQFFRRVGNIYINFVETTTKYHLIDDNSIEADQFTAVYLSPQDPNYFSAFDQPVALYKYKLILEIDNL